MVFIKKKIPEKMIRRRFVFICLLGLITVILSINFYFVYVINAERLLSISDSSRHLKILSKSLPLSSSENYKLVIDSPNRRTGHRSSKIGKNASVVAALKISKELHSLPFKYHKKSDAVQQKVDKQWSDLQPAVGLSTQLWDVAQKWVGARQLVPSQSPLLGSVLSTLSSAKIIKAQNAPGGTQLKLLLTLDGGQRALFKPQWYKREEHIEGPVYSGKDRHNAEVAAFHLSLVLGLRRVPLTVGRKINLETEIVPFASKALLKTFLKDDNNNTCFYGDCHYCNKNDAVCGSKAMMEGALIMMLPQTLKLKPIRSPWQRTYKEHKAAKWEIEENYCGSVKSTKLYNPQNGPRLLDLIDSAIFDFLIDNGDRHHYEVPANVSGAAVMFIDNGKSFGNPTEDHFDILAPLYQCCMVRQSTWEGLQLFSGGVLGTALNRMLSRSDIAPVLTIDHLNAVNRRLLSVFATVELCFKTHGKDYVLRDDGYR